MRCKQILDENPGWDKGGRRLHLQPLSKTSDDIRSGHDHINPATQTGDLQVRSVNLHGCWQRGRQVATKTLQDYGHSVPFERMEKGKSFGMLCPFGDGKIVAIGALQEGESAEEVEEPSEASPPCASGGEHSESVNTKENTGLELEPDLQDLVGSELQTQRVGSGFIVVFDRRNILYFTF